MQHAEIIFEPGAKSVMRFDSEDELKSFLTEHNRRATKGEDGGPAGYPAERIKRVIVYSKHPADYTGEGVNADNVASLLEGMKKDESGKVDGHQLISAVRDEMSPVYPVDQGRHESMYKMSGTDYDLSFLGES